MMIRISRFVRRLLFFSLILLPTLSFAVPLPTIVPQTCNVPGGCQSICDIATLAQNILNFSITLAILASAMWFMITGYMYLTAYSRGESAGLAAAKKRLMHVFLGIVIILGAWFFVNTLISLITTGNLPGGAPWYQICTS